MMRGQSSGTMRPPSGARPSRRMSVKDCEAAWPRVLTYFKRGVPEANGDFTPSAPGARSVEAPRVDHVRDARTELRRPDEGAPLGLSRERSRVDLPDPELHAAHVTAAAEEGVVQVAHELPGGA